MTTPAGETELTELVDADFPRVDLVGKGANGIPRFLITKAGAGLLDPGFVRDLIAKAGPDASEEQVTMTGTPAAIAKLIHQAARNAKAGPDAVEKAELPGAELNDLPDSAFAYIEAGGTNDDQGKTTPRSLRHFPIHDKAHADNAAARIAQGAKFGGEARPKVEAAQRKFGENVSKEAPVADADPVSKDMGTEPGDGTGGLDPAVPLAAPEDGTAPGDPADPGSPAWEAIDAATASKWTSILSRARVAVDILAEREMLEAASADPDDAENAWDLQDVCCAIDYAISVLAPFAVAEQSEADCGADAMAAIGKAMAGFGGVPMDRIEALACVAKAGRVLSAANEAEIRSAAASLQKVLTSLPAAPVADGQVAKEAAVAADQTLSGPAAEPGAPAAITVSKMVAGLPVTVYDASRAVLGSVAPPKIRDTVTKAGDDGKTAQVAVYDAGGSLVGVADPADITPLAGVQAPAKNDAPADATADDASPAAGGDMTPQPAAAAGTPADGVPDDDVTKAAEPPATTETATDVRAVLKSYIDELVRAALDARAPAEGIAKQADVAGLSDLVETLKSRLEVVEGQPAAPKVFTHGAVPPASQMRGQDRATAGTAPAVDVAKAAELKGTLYRGTAAEQNAAATAMQEMAIAQLAAIHGSRG